MIVIRGPIRFPIAFGFGFGFFDSFSVVPQTDTEMAKERHALRLTALRSLAQVKPISSCVLMALVVCFVVVVGVLCMRSVCFMSMICVLVVCP